MEETLLYVIGLIAVGQTGLLVSMSRTLGRLETEVSSMLYRITQLERRRA